MKFNPVVSINDRKEDAATFIECGADFVDQYSPINAPTNGPIIIPHGKKNKPTITPPLTPHMAFREPPNHFVRNIGAK